MRAGDPFKYAASEPAIWRRSVLAVLQSLSHYPPVRSIGKADHEFRDQIGLTVECLEPFTKQAKTFDEHCQSFPDPSNFILQDFRAKAIEEILGLENLKFIRFLRFPSNSAKYPLRIKTAETTYAADMQFKLRNSFKIFMDELARTNSLEEAQQSVQCWRDALRNIFSQVIERVYRANLLGSPMIFYELFNDSLQEIEKAIRGFDTGN